MSEEHFGFSLALVNGDIVLDNGTLRLVSGKRNLLQALELRTLTPFGTDLFNTAYGLDIQEAFTEPGSLHMVKELIKLNLVRTLGADPRVRDIREIQFQDDPAYLARHPEVSTEVIRDLRHRRFWEVEVVIDTVNNQTETLPVNISI